MGKQGPCCHCGVTTTPLWRNGPPDKPVLCNACGSRWRTKGSLVNYTPLHARAEPDDFEDHRVSRVKNISIKNKEAKVLKRKQNYDNVAGGTAGIMLGGGASGFGGGGFAYDHHNQGFRKGLDEDISNRSSSGSAMSNSDGYMHLGSVDVSDLTGPAQSSVVWDTMVPSRKRTCSNRLKQSPVEKLTKDLHTILHEQQSYFSGSSSEDLIFESDTPMVSVEIGHGSVLIRHPNSAAREEESEASSLSVDTKNEAYSRFTTLPVYNANRGGNFSSRHTNMSCKLSLLLRVLIFVALINDVISFLITTEPQVPCYFIFGDSLVDSGNNNELNTSAKANYLPYGIDFPEGVSGRFTNGLTVADIIGQLLGFPKFIPPYATATDQDICTGVNYGSGNAGIRNESGSHLGDRISMDRQLLNHNKTISRLAALQGNKTYTDEYLKKCVYLSNIGSNDYINNYLLPSKYPTNKTYTVNQYAAALVQQYSQQLKTLYNMGARKIALFGLGRIGCTPAEIAKFGCNDSAKFGCNENPCVQWINDAIKLFNENLTSLVDDLNSNCTNAKFTFINITSISEPLGDVPELDATCCQVRDDGQCVKDSNPCFVRALTIFYDGFHPTEISNRAIATRSYIAVSPNDAYPYDISHLASCDIA